MSTCCYGFFHWLIMIILYYRVFDWSRAKDRVSKRKNSQSRFRYEWYTIMDLIWISKLRIIARIINSGMPIGQLELLFVIET